MKKLFQIIWIVLAVIFLGILFLKVWSDSTVVYKSNEGRGVYYWKINKLNGQVQLRGIIAEGDTVQDTGWMTQKRNKP